MVSRSASRWAVLARLAMVQHFGIRLPEAILSIAERVDIIKSADYTSEDDWEDESADYTSEGDWEDE